MSELTTSQRIEQAKIPECDSYVTRGYYFTESELTALLLAVQDEQKAKCADKLPVIEGEYAGEYEARKREIREAEYAYIPHKETA